MDKQLYIKSGDDTDVALTDEEFNCVCSVCGTRQPCNDHCSDNSRWRNRQRFQHLNDRVDIIFNDLRNANEERAKDLRNANEERAKDLRIANTRIHALEVSRNEDRARIHALDGLRNGDRARIHALDGLRNEDRARIHALEDWKRAREVEAAFNTFIRNRGGGAGGGAPTISDLSDSTP
jgi:chromosome segregation ATPase